MRTYQLSGSYVPDGAISRECTLRFDGNCTMNITLKAKPKVERVFTMTKYSGDKVPEHITSLDQLVETKTKHPECYTDFNTSGADYRKIDCIKAVRSVTNWGLWETKEFVEKVSRFGGVITVLDYQRW